MRRDASIRKMTFSTWAFQ